METTNRSLELNRHVDTNGTCLQVEMNESYADLVMVLGEPNCKGDEYKVDAEWKGFFMQRPFTIYNYKTGKNYLGDEGLPVNEITDWHIGGHNKDIAMMLKGYIIALIEAL